MRLEVGPVEPASAVAWLEWAEPILGEGRRGSVTGTPVSTAVVDDLRHSLEQWRPEIPSTQDTFRWRGEYDCEQLEYLVHAFFKLDLQLSSGVHDGERSAVPDKARDFYLVLVRALLHALEMEGAGRAAFVDQLRSSWPIAVAAI